MEPHAHHAVRILIGIGLYLLFLVWTFWPKKHEVDDNPPGAHYPVSEHERAVMAGTVDPLPEYEDRLYRAGEISAFNPATGGSTGNILAPIPSGEIHTGRDLDSQPSLLELAGLANPPYATVDVFLPRGCKCTLSRNSDETFRLDHHPDCPIWKHRPHVDLA